MNDEIEHTHKKMNKPKAMGKHKKMYRYCTRSEWDVEHVK